MKEGRDIPAFKSKLVPHIEHDKKTKKDRLLQLEDRSDVIVRPLDWVRFVNGGNFRPEHSKDSISAEEFASISKKHFGELETYGVRIPVSFTVADDENGKEEVFAIVENVREAIKPDKRIVGLAFAELRTSLLHYFSDKFDSKQSFLQDLSPDLQYVYGKKSGDIEDHLYFIDVEPRIHRSPQALHREIDDEHKIVRLERIFYAMPEYDPICDGFQSLSERAKKEL